MAKVKKYNLEGKESGEIELDDAVFSVKINKSLIHQIYTSILSNSRQPWADSKDKSEVRGGGKKPWKQKGTGRARHGSIRSPLWVGGGLTFGPLKSRNYKKIINKKMSRNAVKMALTDKVLENKMIVLEDLPKEGKTKIFVELLTKLPGFGKSSVLLAESNDPKINLATRNIEKFDMQQAKDVNVVDLLNHQFIFITPAGVEILEKRLK